MAAIEYPPYDGDGASIAPHLPSIADLGGDAKENDPAEPPDPVTMPDARDHNALVRTVSSHGRVTAAMLLSVAFSGGAPYVYAMTTKHSSLDSGDLTLTDNGTGDTTIEWPADSFPVDGVQPFGLTMNELLSVYRQNAAPVSNGVRVVTTDSGGSGIDCAFTVAIQVQ